MNTRFWCARCGRAYERPRELAGRRVRCLACGHVQAIPEPVDSPAPAENGGGIVIPPSPSPSPSPSTYELDSPPVPALPAVPSSASAASPRLERPRRERPASWRDHVRGLTAEAGRWQELSLLLLVLSLLDLFVTFALLRTSPRFYESNPVALWIFSRWNMAGMVFFKLGAIGLAIALGEVIERHRPGWGKGVLVIGSVATAAVVWHGLRLYLGFGPMVEAGVD
jgi:hypothetical protein